MTGVREHFLLSPGPGACLAWTLKWERSWRAPGGDESWLLLLRQAWNTAVDRSVGVLGGGSEFAQSLEASICYSAFLSLFLSHQSLLFTHYGLVSVGIGETKEKVFISHLCIEAKRRAVPPTSVMLTVSSRGQVGPWSSNLRGHCSRGRMWLPSEEAFFFPLSPAPLSFLFSLPSFLYIY